MAIARRESVQDAVRPSRGTGGQAIDRTLVTDIEFAVAERRRSVKIALAVEHQRGQCSQLVVASGEIENRLLGVCATGTGRKLKGGAAGTAGGAASGGRAIDIARSVKHHSSLRTPPVRNALEAVNEAIIPIALRVASQLEDRPIPRSAA